jgi:nitrate/nitrite-specific signal transduction histidine kinase
MKGFRSLTTRYIFLGLTVITLIGLFTALSFWFTNQIKNDGRRINFAGQERYRSFEMAWLLNKAMGERVEEREKTFNYITTKERPEFEEILYGLRDGSKRYNLKPLSHYQSIRKIDGLIQRWHSRINPTLIKAVEGSPEAFKEYNTIIHDYVYEIDSLVAQLEKDYERELMVYGRLRIGAIVLAFFVFLAMALFVRKSLVTPLLLLRDASEEARKGNLDVRVDIESEDEIGLLSMAFNSMALTCKQEEERLREYSERLEEQFRLVVSAKREWQDTFDNITDMIFIHDREILRRD